MRRFTAPLAVLALAGCSWLIAQAPLPGPTVAGGPTLGANTYNGLQTSATGFLGLLYTTGTLYFNSGAGSALTSSANGELGVSIASAAKGLHYQFAAAPTIASGFGTSPSIAGVDSAGKITVGTGGVATTGAVTFATTWTTAAPVCLAGDETTTLLVKATPTTTTLTLTSASAWGAGDVLSWTCVRPQ